MKRRIISVLAAAGLMSCGIYEIESEGVKGSDGGVWGGPIAESGGAAARSISYMTALDYQKEYDWRSDQARESVKCSLVVYADGSPIMKVPVGAAYETGSDPDMHRIIDGHLYTDYSTDTETVIKKDGVLLFRYQGAEAVCDMKVRDGDVYTLGQSRDGDGFTFRKNGTVILERNDGSVIGGLTEDADSLCFAFSEHIRSAQGIVGRYYQAVGCKVSQIALREDIKTVWDVLPGSEHATYLASLTGLASPVIINDGPMLSLSMPSGSSMLSCRLFRLEDKVGAEGLYRLRDGTFLNAIWLDGKVVAAFPKGEVVSALEVHEGGIFCAINPSVVTGSGTIYRCGEIFAMPAGYSVMGSDGMAVVDGILHVGLSSLNGKKPLLWKDGQLDSLNINGFISTVCVGSAD